MYVHTKGVFNFITNNKGHWETIGQLSVRYQPNTDNVDDLE